MRKLILFTIVCFSVLSTLSAQNTFRSVQDGDWDDASTWFSGAGTGGIEGINYPSSTDSVFVLHDVDITATNSGNNFLFEGYLNIAAGVKLQCEVGDSNDGLLLDNNAVVHVYGTLYTAKAGDVPATASPGAVEFTSAGNSTFIAFSGASLFVADDWEIEDNAIVYIEDNVCLRVDDDVNFDGTGWTMCGSGDISIGGDGASSTVNFGGGSSSAQICAGTSIIRNLTGVDCSSGTTVSTGTGDPGAPPIAVDDKISTEINQNINISVLTLGVDDSDPLLDTLQILKIGSNVAIDDNLSANGGVISINDNGTPTDFADDFVFYAPPAGFTGEDTFSYVIEDEDGLTDTALVTINVFNCGSTYVDLIGVGANGATTATLTFTDTASIDSIRLDLIYKNGKPTFATFVSSAGESNSGSQFDAINIAGNDDGVYRTTINTASSVTVTHDNSGGVRSFLAYIYRQGKVASITSIADNQVVYLFQDTYTFTQDIPAGNTPRNIKIQMPISELNDDSRSALLEVTAGPVSGSLETFSQDLGNSLKIFTLILEDVPGDVTELEVTITSKTGGAGDSFVTAGIDFGIQCSGTAPDAIPDNASTPENTAVTIDILDNDILGNGGFDTTSITNLGLLDPQNGTVTFNSSGQAVYTPDGGFTGIDYFQYQVCDSLQLCAITTVTVSVTCSGGQFVEVAEAVGLDLGGNKDGGLSWADFNNDGLLDVIVNTNDGTNDTRIYFAEETSGVITFTDVTTTNASGLLDNTNDRSVVTGDLNNDGYTDFVRNDFNGTGVEIWFNRGPGSSPAYSFGNGSQDENISINTFGTSNNTGDGFNTEGVSIVDWNQDGWLDIIVENDGDGVEILENDQDGTFSEVAHATSGFTDAAGGSDKGDYSTAIDYDNDGFVDYMARRADDADLYHFNSATGEFEAVAGLDLSAGGEKGAITFCDVDNDSDFDIIWAHQMDDNNSDIYLQGSDGTFTFSTTLVSDAGVEECDCADVDNDGDNDIFLGDDAGNSYLFKNNTVKGGAVSFTQDNDCIAPGADVEGAEFVDYDNDGDMDLYMNINGGDNQLWQNGQDDENYLRVIPRIDLGSGRYRSAIGANVVLIENCTDTCQIRDVSGGRGHGSQKPEVLHFGLPNGPEKGYKILVYFVDKDGTRTVVTKSVTPASLENQEIIIYDTDDNYDLCLDADSDGILNIDDIDDDNDGVLDVDEACPSYPIVVTSQTGVGDSGNITGVPDGAFADLYSNGDIIVIDFGAIFPAGTEYILTWRERTGQSGTAEPIIEESTDNSDYTTNTFTPTTNSTTVVSTLITSQNSFRYLRISKDNPPSVTDFEIDAVALNTCTDTDGDGVANSVDLDSDNDGVTDIIEAGGVDTDGDGRVDVFADANGDGWATTFDPINGGTPLDDEDTDGDGLNDRIDLDSDNDGVQDILEAGGEDFDGDGKDNGIDSDGDGLNDNYDTDSGGTPLADADSDLDGFKNRLDLDSDNDGIGDLTETGGEDSDLDGLVDGVFTDTDGDGWSDTYDSDDGGSSLSNEDQDEDGFPNRIDIDADNDGIIDIVESQPTGTLIIPSGTDSDNDGIDDNFDPDSGNTLTNPENTDGTDNPDYLDLDTDNDGDPDLLEGWDTDNDGVAENVLINIDSDNDGLDDGFDTVTQTSGNGKTTNVTDNGKDSEDYPDLDEPNTLEKDWREDKDNDNDGIADDFDLDDDNDGIPDLIELDCTSGNADLVFSTAGSVSFSSQALGDFDGSTAQINSGDILTLDLTDIVPAGKFIRIRMSRENNNRILVEGSSDDATYTNAVTYGSSSSDNHMPTIGLVYDFLYETGVDGVRYLRFTREVGSTRLDGVSYTPICTILDSDGDGIEDQFDLDSDNDGIPDIVEAGGEDTNGDGLVDDLTGTALTNDTDGDGLDDRYDSGNGGEDITNPDTDGDGINDVVDLDADNDGIPDVVEAGGTDENGDGRADDYVDTDVDGFNDVVDGDVGNDGTAENTSDALTVTGDDTNDDGIPDSYPEDDTDGDGIVNVLDLDSDNDGIPDVVEAGGTDENGDGRADDYLDADGDGFNDRVDGDPTNALAVGVDTDGANAANAATKTDADADLDGVPDSYPNDDFDGDGVLNYLDLDADDDGIMDVVEQGGSDTDRDGLEDSYVDADGDGFNDLVDGDSDNSLVTGDDSVEADAANATTLTDTDADLDGVPDDYPNDDFDDDGHLNYLDIDADNDGIVDNTEGQPTATYVAPANADTDGDGIDDNYDDLNGFGGTGAVGYVLSDIDGTENPDYLDLDTDNDGDLDEVEGHDTDNDGIADGSSIANTGLPGGTTDTDGDGLLDGYDNNTSSQDPTNGGFEGEDYTNIDNPSTTESDWREVLDNDNDGITDIFDLDNDNDGIPDLIELDCTSGNADLVFSTAGSVSFSSQALGDFDGSTAQLNSGDILTLDLTDIVPVGQFIRIRMSRENGNRILVEGSLDNTGGSYTNPVTYGSSSADNDMPTIGVLYDLIYEVGAGGVRYLRFTREVGSSRIDGVSYAPQCTVLDTDGDGIEDQFDLDSDNDGIPDIVEAGGEDTNGDGLIDDLTGTTLTNDTDGDGLDDRYDSGNGGDDITNPDTDGDGINDVVDLDADNDGIPDVVEAGGTDENGDGRADDYVDTDVDGFNDVVDGDVGNDGTAENTSDALTVTGDDTNDDGIPDTYPNDDTDGDGIVNALDLDADNDGIPDVVEAGGTDENGDGRADDYVDADLDGFNDVVDGDPTNALAVGTDTPGTNTSDALTLTDEDADLDGEPDNYPNDDFDGDGVLNYLDLDADDDGIMDVVEQGGSDTDRDGLEDSYVDADGDGFNDNVDGDTDNSLAIGVDTDGGQQANATTLTDADADLDGVPDDYPNDDFDNDGHLNYLDIDADNDGIVDNTEGQPTATYVAPDNADADGDGIDDAYDDLNGFGGTGAVGYLLSDIDGTENPDYLDLDSDGDGYYDILEGHDSNGDGVADGSSPANTGFSGGTTDVDGDGLYDGWDNNTSSQDPTNGGLEGDSHPDEGNTISAERDWREVPDADNDGIADVDDIDDDNDGILDTDECVTGDNFALSTNGATASQSSLASGGSPGRGNDGNTSGVYGNNSVTHTSNSTDPFWIVDLGSVQSMSSVNVWNRTDACCVTRLNDFILEVLDADSNVVYFYQESGTPSTTTNIDLNVQGRYVRVRLEGASRILSLAEVEVFSCADKDGDGVSDQYDLDSDGDGIADIIEAGGIDANNDGVVDGTFDDGVTIDGWSDVFDVADGGAALADGDQDGDLLPNRCDLDSDDDGLQDAIESGGTDADGDGLEDGASLIVPVNTDGDVVANYLDLDSDNDGIIDNIEWQTTGNFDQPSGTDADNNGWDDEYDDGVVEAVSNNDGAGDGADYIDLNSDTDSQPDWLERADDDEDGDALLDLVTLADAYETTNGNPNHYVSTDDADGDDIPDFAEDDDGDGNVEASDSDGIPNFLDPNNVTHYRDTDNDGLVDFYDADHNGDNRDNVNQLSDLDNNGAPDFRDGTNDVTLPVQLIEFKAAKVGAYVQLDWKTATEINNDYFTIERSIDGENFEEILTQQGAGNSSSINNYRGYDEQPEVGYNYYKLTQTDFNGESESFNIEVVKFDGDGVVKNNISVKMNVYPNPSEGEVLTLDISTLEEGLYNLEILTAKGKLIGRRVIENDSEQSSYEVEVLEGKRLAAGTYYLRVVSNDAIEILPFIVK